MELTAKQEEGLKIAVARYRNHDRYTTISGYAGTGKSTLIQFIINALNIDPKKVIYCAYTGKATQVLQSKGCKNCSTLHKLIYHTYRDDYGGFHFVPKKELDEDYKLIVVDEVSMVPKNMWDLLLSYRVHVIALGDPGQLPPVNKKEYNDILEHPHVFLSEIMRQASESSIIRLTMDIRAGLGLNANQYINDSEVKILDAKALQNDAILQWADQILVSKNQTRYDINRRMHTILTGDTTLVPQNGEKVICLHNNWECCNSAEDPLINGAIGELNNIIIPTKEDRYVESVLYGTFTPDYSPFPFEKLKIDKKIFTHHEESANIHSPGRVFPKKYAPEYFDFGYAITCHKSQGSEFKKVLVIEEKLRLETRDEHIKWLYTAATRASEKLLIIKA